MSLVFLIWFLSFSGFLYQSDHFLIDNYRRFFGSMIALVITNRLIPDPPVWITRVMQDGPISIGRSRIARHPTSAYNIYISSWAH